MQNLVQIHSKSGKQYWRSLDEMAGTPEFRQWAEREFGAGASEMTDSASRRTLLKLMAASFGLAGLTACRRPVEKILPFSKGVEDFVHGKPLHYSTALIHAGVAAGVQVKCVDGRPVKVEGNPRHPYSLGATNAYQQAALLELYDPDRPKYPQRSASRVSWAEFDKFAADHFTTEKLGDGAGLRILAESSSSPSLAAVQADLLKKFPKAQWVEYDSVTHEAVRQGAALAFGQRLEPVYRFDKADVVVAFDLDFLGVDSPTILPTRQFSAKRRVADPKDSSNRLYVAEANYTITGAMADHRLRVRASDAPALVMALARELNVSGAELKVVGNNSDLGRKFIAAVAKDLAAHKGKSLVVAGPRQPAAVHAVVALINQALTNMGETLTYVKPALAPSDRLQQFKEDLAARRVSTLVCVGGNPAYTLPADLDFTNAVKNVATRITLAAEANETWHAAEWQLPQSHPFEAWSDARALDGTATIAQPMIEPLYESRSILEVAALLSGTPAKSYTLVQGYWKAQWPAAEAESRWRKSVHDGIVQGSAESPVKVSAEVKKVLSVVEPLLKPAQPGWEAVFYPDASLYDGRYANNAWLQEAPDPMTKLVWDNAALLSAKSAQALNVENGDVIEIMLGARSVKVPAMIMPGHADDSLSLSLGYGRYACGRVGQNVGHNVGPLRTSDAFHIASAVSVRKTGARYELVTTQEHHTLVEPITGNVRPIVREATLEEYSAHPEHALGVHAEDLFSMYPDFDYTHGYQWGMAIDLHACTGCNACVLACVAENNVPVVGKDQVRRGREMHWIRMDRYYTGNVEDPQVVWQPMACQQCENAPCESVCPVAATTHSPEGLNEMAYNRCVGTRYCSNNCPYKVRRFNFLNWHRELEESTRMVYNPDVSVRMRGVMEKCNYCVQRIQTARISAKAEQRRQLKDGDVITACQQVCPADAIVFGNLLDPESKVAKMKQQPRDYKVLEELNTRPRTTYQAKLRNVNPELA